MKNVKYYGTFQIFNPPNPPTAIVDNSLKGPNQEKNMTISYRWHLFLLSSTAT